MREQACAVLISARAVMRQMNASLASANIWKHWQARQGGRAGKAGTRCNHFDGRGERKMRRCLREACCGSTLTREVRINSETGYSIGLQLCGAMFVCVCVCLHVCVNSKTPRGKRGGEPPDAPPEGFPLSSVGSLFSATVS